MTTKTQQWTVPPYRADLVGSLLRPAALLEARRKHSQDELDDRGLRVAEDEAIRDVIRFQENLGYEVVTDGEFRRGVYWDNFLETALTGVLLDREQGSWAFHGAKTAVQASAHGGKGSAAPLPLVVERIRWSGKATNAVDFAFVKANTKKTGKVTLPGPCYIHYRSGRSAISEDVYPDLDLFWSDIVEAYRQELNALHLAGCTYVQLDETSLAKFADPNIQKKLQERGDNWQELLSTYIQVMNAVAEVAPKGMLLGTHLCRGNNQGQWQAAGGYELVAKSLFQELRIPVYLLEFDSPRAGSLGVLRALPDGKGVVLGLISTKTSTLESREEVLRRIQEAASYTPLERLALSPQCGFASVEFGNPISPEMQEAKLRLVTEIAATVWG